MTKDDICTSSTHGHDYSYKFRKRYRSLVLFGAQKLVPEASTLYKCYEFTIWTFKSTNVHVMHSSCPIHHAHITESASSPLVALYNFLVKCIHTKWAVMRLKTDVYSSSDKYSALLPGCTKLSLSNSKLKSPCTHANQRCIVILCTWI